MTKFAVILTFALWLPAMARSEWFLVKDGQPNAEIVIAGQSARAAEFGAEELQAYLEKITGARLEIVKAQTAGTAIRIFVGEIERARLAGMTAEGLKRDAFRMVSGQSWLARSNKNPSLSLVITTEVEGSLSPPNTPSERDECPLTVPLQAS